VRRLVRGLVIFLLVGLIVSVPSTAWASTGHLVDAVGASSQALEQELQQAAALGLSESEHSRIAYELRGVKDPYARPSWWNAPSFYRAQQARAEAARASLRFTYGQELDLARGGLLRGVRGFSELVASASARGIEVGAFAEQVAGYRDYAAQAATINEYRDLATFLAPKGGEVRQLVSEFNREDEAARDALRDARQTLAEARNVANLQLGGYAGALEQIGQELTQAHRVPELHRVGERAREQQGSIRELLDMRAAAYGAAQEADTMLQRAREAKVDTGEAAAAIANLRARLNNAGTYDAFSNIAWNLRQQKRLLADAIWLQSVITNAPSTPGKIIDINLSTQRLNAYQDGRLIVSTIITSGRPELPTPPGSYTIMAKYSPYRMVSPWPYGSPWWYETSDMTYAMLFRGGGYFIHDAPWRSLWGNPWVSGSHGCVNVPFGPMSTLFAFAEIGTPVAIHW
jgi:lipoprotein-anchoring transpeptidase ErfK/SrfK